MAKSRNHGMTITQVEAAIEAHPEWTDRQRDAARIGYTRLLAAVDLSKQALETLGRFAAERTGDTFRFPAGRPVRTDATAYDLELWCEAIGIADGIRREFRRSFAVAYNTGSRITLNFKGQPPVQ